MHIQHLFVHLILLQHINFIFRAFVLCSSFIIQFSCHSVIVPADLSSTLLCIILEGLMGVSIVHSDNIYGIKNLFRIIWTFFKYNFKIKNEFGYKNNKKIKCLSEYKKLKKKKTKNLIQFPKRYNPIIYNFSITFFYELFVKVLVNYPKSFIRALPNGWLVSVPKLENKHGMATVEFLWHNRHINNLVSRTISAMAMAF